MPPAWAVFVPTGPCQAWSQVHRFDVFILLSPPNFPAQWRSDGTQFMTDMLAAQLFAVPQLDALGSQWDDKILKICFKNNVNFSAADGMARVLNCGSPTVLP